MCSPRESPPGFEPRLNRALLFPRLEWRDPPSEPDLYHPRKEERYMATILWILAVILVISGIFAIIRKQLLWGIVLIVVGLLVGPGGVSVFT
jgi:hypothetical protein